MDLNRNLTNDEILAIPEVEDALNDGKIMVIHKEDTSHPDYVNMYFIGIVKGLSSSNTDVNSLQAQLLGWKGTMPMRAIQNSSKAIADQVALGTMFDGTIRVFDTLTKQFDAQTSRIDRNGKQLLHQGKPIYRNTEICDFATLERLGHDTLEVDRTPVQKPQSSGQVAGSEVNTSPSSSVNTLLGNQA